MKAIINARILCPTQGLIENGSIVFNEEKIHTVGESSNVKLPEGTEVIDGQNKYFSGKVFPMPLPGHHQLKAN